MSSELKLYNTLNRSKQTFVPLDANNVRVYVCGPTVYDYPHVGNARPLIVFDLLFRLLSQIFEKEKVQYVRNITDVDDKILESAKSKNISIQDLTKKVIKDFHDDCSYLNCLTPTKEPKATDHIQEMIELTIKLIEKKFAYIKKGHVYFEVSKYKDYGSLSNKKIDELISGSRVEISKSKKSPVDFLPLTVDYKEKFASAGRFPGGYFKREGRPSEKEILTSRLCDRPCRPLFPEGFIDEIQLQCIVLSHDTQNDSDVIACTGASAALSITDAPFQGPIATVRVGRVITEQGSQSSTPRSSAVPRRNSLPTRSFRRTPRVTMLRRLCERSTGTPCSSAKASSSSASTSVRFSPGTLRLPK